MDVAQRAAGVIATSGVRVEVLAATFLRTARNGCFSRSLTEVLGGGLADLSADYIDAPTALDRAAAACPDQEAPLRFAMARGRRIAADPGLWLARNPEAAGRWALAGTTEGGHAVDLTRIYQLTDALEHVTASIARHPVTVVVGGPGSGKSALVAALARPDVAGDLIPASYLRAVAFTDLTPTTLELARTLHTQLRLVPEFAAAVDRHEGVTDPDELAAQPPLQRLLTGPAGLLDLPKNRRLRLAVDGLDRLDPTTRTDVLTAVTALTGPTNGAPLVRVLLTGRPDALDAFTDHEAGVELVRLEPPAPQEISEYTRQAGVPGHLAPVLAGHASTWLDVSLLTGAIIQTPDADLSGVDDLAGLYDALLTPVTAQLGAPAGAVLGILAAAGTGPTLPATLAAAACEHLHTPLSLAALRDVLAALGGLTARSEPGTPNERVGLFHDTLTTHLTTRPPADRPTVRDGHEAILTALEHAEPDDAAAAAYRRTRGPKHLWALDRHAEALAAIYATLGHRAADNAAVLQPWVDGATQVLGPDHPDTLASRNNLAYAYQEAGRLSEATSLYEATLVDSERVLGPDHPNTLTSRNNLAGAYQAAGRLDEAIPLYQATLADRERVLGPDHPDTLTSRNNLAGAYQAAGRLDEATRLRQAITADSGSGVGGADEPG